MTLAWRTVEVGVYLNAKPVTDNEKRRVSQRHRVTHHLVKSDIKPLTWGLVLPSEAIPLENIRKSRSLTRRAVALFKHVPESVTSPSADAAKSLI